MPETIAYVLPKVLDYQFARLRAASSAFAERGQEVVCVECTKGSLQYPWEARQQPSGFRMVTVMDDPEPLRSFTGRRCKKKLLAVLGDLAPRCVVVCGMGLFVMRAAARWARRRKIPVVMTSDTPYSHKPRYRLKEFLKRLAMPPVDAVFASGRRAAEYIMRFGVPRERIFFGMDAVDNALFAAGAEEARSSREALRSRLRLPEGRFFLSVMRLTPEKNIPFLIRTYARYRRECGPGAWGLALCGPGPLKDQILRLATDLHVDNAVLLPGFVRNAEVPSYMGLASAYVQTSVSESWGLAVNEAMASGLPVLVSEACGCSPELVAAGKNGWTFDPHNEQALLDLLLRMTRLPEEQRAAMGKESQRIIADWGLERFARGLLDAVECACKRQER